MDLVRELHVLDLLPGLTQRRCHALTLADVDPLVILSVAEQHGHANLTCIQACRAEVSIEGKWFVIRTDTANCARVEWQGDGLNVPTTVLDGQERLEILISLPKDVRILRCTEIKDLRLLNRSEAAVPAAKRQQVMVPIKCTYEGSSTPIATVKKVVYLDEYPTNESRALLGESVCAPIIGEANRECILFYRLDNISNDPAQPLEANSLRVQGRAQGPRPAHCD